MTNTLPSGSKPFLLSVGTLASRCLGLLRDMAMAALFDRAVTDAWTVAFRLPNFCRRVFGEGALSLGFIPHFIEIEKGAGKAAAHNLVNAAYTLLLIVFGAITVLGVIFAEPILRLFLHPEYANDAVKFMLTLRMAKIMFGFVFFMVSYAYLMAVLQALGEFRWPAFAPLLFNVAMISFTLMPGTWFHFPGEGLAWGVLVGGFIQAAILIPILRQKNYFPRRILNFWSSDLRSLLVRLGPVFLSLGVLQLVTLINLYFASQLGPGVISAIYWADRLMELPLSLVSVSLSVASLPFLATAWGRNEKQLFRDSVGEQLRVNAVWMIPASLGLFFLAEPIVRVLFFRGEFTSKDVEQTTTVLQIYAIGLLALGQIRLLINAFSAAKGQGEASLWGASAIFIHCIFAPLLIRQWGLQGLMLSTLVCYVIQFFALAILFARRLGTLEWKNILATKAKLLLCCGLIPFSGSMFFYLEKWELPGVLSLGLCVGVCALSYLAFGRLGRVHRLFTVFG